MSLQGLANLYSKGVGQDDVTDAIATYSKLISFSQGYVLLIANIQLVMLCHRDDSRMIELLQKIVAVASKLNGACSQVS